MHTQQYHAPGGGVVVVQRVAQSAQAHGPSMTVAVMHESQPENGGVQHCPPGHAATNEEPTPEVQYTRPSWSGQLAADVTW